eukprot:3409166-Lingulodinium_polyedra.AAC.1
MELQAEAMPAESVWMVSERSFPAARQRLVPANGAYTAPRANEVAVGPLQVAEFWVAGLNCVEGRA